MGEFSGTILRREGSRKIILGHWTATCESMTIRSDDGDLMAAWRAIRRRGVLYPIGGHECGGAIYELARREHPCMFNVTAVADALAAAGYEMVTSERAMNAEDWERALALSKERHAEFERQRQNLEDRMEQHPGAGK
jgi:hypothetical protein